MSSLHNLLCTSGSEVIEAHITSYNHGLPSPYRFSTLRLFSSDQSRVQESWHTLVMKINNLSFATFQRNMQPHIEKVTKMDGDCSSEETYEFFLTKVL